MPPESNVIPGAGLNDLPSAGKRGGNPSPASGTTFFFADILCIPPKPQKFSVDILLH